ncbi:MAG: molecular chaperone TorD family protein [Rhodospirillaceae bacterium]|jgi:TorA maturation chaperone TorD|nr:molecular chaperone TorD family protein [Rhodospirillaceae bacterium]
MAEMAMARANVYGLLADVFREEPSEAFLINLGEPEFSGSFHALNLSLDEMFENTPYVQLVDDLAVEFTRLFIGPTNHISPHESMHTEARFGEKKALWGDRTVEVKKFMQTVGLEVDDSFGGMPDHISAEFEFMQQLLLKEANAWINEQDDLGRNILNIENKFYDEHLSHWVSDFCDTVAELASHIFYRQFSEVTKGFMDFEKETLQTLITEVEERDRLSA